MHPHDSLAARRRVGETFTCQTCGGVFRIWRSGIRGKFCSKECRDARLLHIPLAERWWASVDKDGPVPAHRPDLGPCWLWTGAVSPDGYGTIAVDRKPRRAHRVGWELHRGPIPNGLQANHHCDTKRCVRFDTHLYIGDQRQNVHDAIVRGRFTVGERNGARMHPERMARGEANGNVKLTTESVMTIRRLYDTGAMAPVALAAHFGVTIQAIHQIIKRKTWRHVPDS